VAVCGCGGLGMWFPGHGRAFHCVSEEEAWFLDADTGWKGFVSVVLEEKGKGKGRGWRRDRLAYREEQRLRLEGIFEEM